MKENPNVLIFLKQISRNSGGMSSALDLSEAIYNLGFDTNVVVMKYDALLKNQIKKNIGIRSKMFSHLLPFNCIYPFPNFEKKESTIGLKEIALLFDSKKRNAKKKLFDLLKNADIVFFACMLPYDIHQKFRTHSNAKFVYNHAGSPETYEEYWLKDIHVAHKTNMEERYVKFCQRFDYILFQAKDQATDCIYRGGINKEKCIVLSPSCEENKVLSSKLYASPYAQKRKHIVYIGSIQPRKAQDLAIKAFFNVSEHQENIDLHFVGGGLDTDYAKELFKLSNQLNLKQRIHFHGHRTDYLRYMAHADIIIQTSKAEGVSRVLREAMLLKKPIVSFAISGTNSILKAGEDALLIKFGDVKKMGHEIQRLLNDRMLIEKLVSNSYKKYLLNHSSPSYIQNISELLRNIHFS